MLATANRIILRVVKAFHTLSPIPATV